MRMLHYFGAVAALCVPALFLTTVAGLLGWPNHLMIGLVTAVLVVGTHTLLILFMIVTGRVLKAAMASRPLSGSFLEQLNEFFARRQAYPVAILAAFLTVATAVLGYSQRGFDLSPAIHLLAGVATVAVNLFALGIEYRALADNQDLLDRAAAELDRIDHEHPELARDSGVDEEVDAATLERWGLVLMVSAWMPWAYWAVVEHRGDFAGTSIHPWLEGSLLGLLVWWLARRERQRGELAAGHDAA